MSGPIPGYPLPVQDPNRHEVRADPDEENPHELVLGASEVNAALPPLPPRRPPATTGEQQNGQSEEE